MTSAERDRDAARYLTDGIRRLRKSRGLTQEQLSSRCGWSQSMMSRMENPTYGAWSGASLTRIALALEARLRVRFLDDSLDAEGETP